MQSNQRTALFHLLATAAMGADVTTDDVKALPVRPDSDRDEVRTMRREVLRHAKAITALRRNGQHQNARTTACAVAEEWSHLVGRDGPAPVTGDGMSPAALADLIAGKQPTAGMTFSTPEHSENVVPR